MNTGILFYDRRDIPLSEKIKNIILTYEKKFGRPPNVVEVSLNEGNADGLSINVQHYRYILPNHMLVGVEDE